MDHVIFHFYHDVAISFFFQHISAFERYTSASIFEVHDLYFKTTLISNTIHNTLKVNARLWMVKDVLLILAL